MDREIKDEIQNFQKYVIPDLEYSSFKLTNQHIFIRLISHLFLLRFF